MSDKNENAQKESTPFDVARMKGWYKEQISMAKLRTELAELMAREAKAGAERLHFLGSIASMQGPQAGAKEAQPEPEENNITASAESDSDLDLEKEASDILVNIQENPEELSKEAVVRSIFQ